MAKRLILSLLTLSTTVLLHAQVTDFVRLRSKMTSKSLPFVNLIFDKSDLRTDRFTEGRIDICDVQKRTEGQEEVSYIAKFRIRGTSAAGLSKKSFAVKLYDESGEDLNVNIFGIRSENSWILDAMGFDRARMRTRICFDLWNELSGTPYETKYENRNGTKGVFVEVFINGMYQGLYCMTDKIDRKLLGLKKFDKPKTEGGDITYRGLLYKGISWDSGCNLRSYNGSESTNSKNWNAWELQYPEDYPSAEAWQPLKDLINFCSDKTSNNVFSQKYQDYFYSSNLEDYMLMTMALNVGDNLYKNTFLSVPDIKNGTRYILTPWDMDMSLGALYNGNYNNTTANPSRYKSAAPFNRLYEKNVDGFADRVKKRWCILQNSIFSVEHVHEIVDNYGRLLTESGAWQREYSKWKNSYTPLREDLSEELLYIKNWYVKNFDSLCQKWGRVTVDVNSDGELTEADVKAIADHMMGHTPKGFNEKMADVNGDGKVNVSDIVELVKLIK